MKKLTLLFALALFAFSPMLHAQSNLISEGKQAKEYKMRPIADVHLKLVVGDQTFTFRDKISLASLEASNFNVELHTMDHEKVMADGVRITLAHAKKALVTMELADKLEGDWIKLMKQAKAGDRLVIEVNGITRHDLNNGETAKAEDHVFTIPIVE